MSSSRTKPHPHPTHPHPHPHPVTLTHSFLWFRFQQAFGVACSGSSRKCENEFNSDRSLLSPSSNGEALFEVPSSSSETPSLSSHSVGADGCSILSPQPSSPRSHLPSVSQDPSVQSPDPSVQSPPVVSKPQPTIKTQPMPARPKYNASTMPSSMNRRKRWLWDSHKVGFDSFSSSILQSHIVETFSA